MPETEQTWEFTFQVVVTAETYADALQAAHDYIAEYAAKMELEPVKSRKLE